MKSDTKKPKKKGMPLDRRLTMVIGNVDKIPDAYELSPMQIRYLAIGNSYLRAVKESLPE